METISQLHERLHCVFEMMQSAKRHKDYATISLRRAYDAFERGSYRKTIARYDAIQQRLASWYADILIRMVQKVGAYDGRKPSNMVQLAEKYFQTEKA